MRDALARLDLLPSPICTCTSCRRRSWQRCGATSTGRVLCWGGPGRSATEAPIANGSDLRDCGVGLFAGLSYAHKPEMAEYLTDWSLAFAAEVPEAVATGTFFPEPGVGGYVSEAIERGCQLFKIHLQVGDFDPRDPRLDPVWDVLSATGTPVIIHAGSGPVPGRFTGPEPLRQVLARFPHLPAVIAHFGSLRSASSSNWR